YTLNTPVTAVKPLNIGNKRWSLQTPRGSVSCRYVVHATNAYAGHLIPHMNGQAGILPTRGQVIAGNLVILGGGRMSAEPSYEPTTDDSTGYLRREQSVEMEWTGIMGYTRMTDPFVGPLIDPTEPRSPKYEAPKRLLQ
ncbi:hypothetical protein MPER_05926, partial [Moniliophthora perniciosa FA553]